MSTRVIVGTLRRERHLRVAFTAEPATPRPTAHRPAAVARMLALAHHVQRAIDRGALTDAADAARRLGFTRARIGQLLNLVLLAPDIQEAIAHLEAVDGVEPLTERTLRPVARETDWAEQRALWRVLAERTAKGSTLLNVLAMA